MILVTKTSDQTRHVVCVCVFIKLHITAQSGPRACRPSHSMPLALILLRGDQSYLLRVCVYGFIKLHMTAQSGPVIYSFYATACNPPGGLLIVNILLARNARAHSYDSSPRYDPSRPET